MSTFMGDGTNSRSLNAAAVFVFDFWRCDVAGVWHYIRSGWHECIKEHPILLFDGRDMMDRADEVPPKDAWVCAHCRAEMTKRIVEES